jgi:hypothetical protein
MAQSFGLVDRNLKIIEKSGSLFINRCFKYISPCMKLYGEEFTTKMRLLSGLAVAIQDYGFNTEKTFKNEIYYLIDVNGVYRYDKYMSPEKSRVDFMHVISWLRQQDFYVKDYPFDSGRHGHKHIICLKIPINVIDNFLQGKYSQMYNKDTLDKIVPKTITVDKQEIINPVFGVLSHDAEYLPYYLDQLNKEYNTTVTEDDIKHHSEYDIPPLPKNEILRW